MAIVPATEALVLGRVIPGILFELCRERGGSLFIEPEFGYVGYLDLPGRRILFRGSSLDIDGGVARELVKDKAYCSEFLRHHGHTVPDGVLLYSGRFQERMRLVRDELHARVSDPEPLEAFVARHGFPLYVKPNEGMEGRGVAKAHDGADLRAHLDVLFQTEDRVLLQPAIPGRDYRFVVIDGATALVLERQPAAVTGDGTRTLAALIIAKLTELRATRRGPRIDLADPRIARELAAQGLRLDDTPAPGAFVRLLPGANLSSGGTFREITAACPEKAKGFAEAVARDLGLRVAGIDVICPDIADPDAPRTVLEVNSSPGFVHFAMAGADHRDKAKALYRRMIDIAMGEDTLPSDRPR